MEGLGGAEAGAQATGGTGLGVNLDIGKGKSACLKWLLDRLTEMSKLLV
jgi:hypothetical protein